MKQLAIRTAGILCALVLWTGAGIAEETGSAGFEGLIEPFEMVNVGTPVEGVVELVNVQRSALVKKGETLVAA